jgi:endonuclease YncB( thermonuclease family)
MAKKFQLWVSVFSWHDADTFRGVVDQALWTYRGRDSKPVLCRAALIQAPELIVAGRSYQVGLAARDFAAELAPPGEYPCWSYKPDPENYGRPLLDLILPDGRLFSAAMIAAGYAVPYKT